MNNKQYKKAVKIVKHCAEVDRKLVENGRFCVIGSFLSFVGYSNDEIEDISREDSTGLHDRDISRKMEMEFGLSKDELYSLQQTNDEYSDTDERRIALLEELTCIKEKYGKKSK